MKKLLLSAILSTALLSCAAAFDWGGLLKEDLKYTSSDFSQEQSLLRQSNGISLWFTEPITPDNSWYVTGQASYRYNLDFYNGDSSFTSIFDVDLLKLNGSVQTGSVNAGISIGRFSVSDLTGKIFSQMCDGISLKVAFPTFQVSAYGGTTGLLNALDVTMLGEGGTAHTASGTLYANSHQYIPVSLALSVPSLFLNQTLNLQVNGFIDVEPDLYQRFYASLGFNGPISGPLYYSLATVFGTSTFHQVYNYSSIFAHIFLNSNITLKLGAEYASGQQLIFTPFVGFTSTTAYNSVNSPVYSGVILPAVDLVFTKGSFYTDLNTKVVLDYPEEEITFKGINLLGQVVYNIFSDVQLGLTGTYYLDINTQGAENYISINLNGSVSF